MLCFEAFRVLSGVSTGRTRKLFSHSVKHLGRLSGASTRLGFKILKGHPKGGHPKGVGWVARGGGCEERRRQRSPGTRGPLPNIVQGPRGPNGRMPLRAQNANAENFRIWLQFSVLF